MFKEELNKFTGDRSGKGCNTRVSEVPNSQQLSREVCGEKHCPVTPFTLCFCTHSFRLVWRICSWPLAEKAVRLVLMVRKILALGWFDREHFFGRLCCSFFFFFFKKTALIWPPTWQIPYLHWNACLPAYTHPRTYSCHAYTGFVFSHLAWVHWEPKQYTVSSTPSRVMEKSNAPKPTSFFSIPLPPYHSYFCFLQRPRFWFASGLDDHLQFQITLWIFRLHWISNVETSRYTCQENVLLEALHFKAFGTIFLWGSI